MFSLIVLTTVVLVFVYKAIVWYSEFSVLKRKVNLIPGPSGWPFIGSVPELLRSLRTGDFTRMMFQEYPEKYGRIFRFWIGRTPRIVLCSAKHVEPLLNSTRLIKKSVDYDLVRDWLGDGLLISSGDKWRTRRRLITPTFHFTILNDFVPVFISNAAVFAEVLRRKKGTDEPFDVFPLASLCALDIICDCAMGVEVNAQMGQDSDYVTAVKRLSNIANTRSLQPWYASDFVFNLSPEGREHKQLLKKVHAFTEKVISRRRGELQCESVSETLNNSRVRKRAFLDLLLSSDLQLTDSDVQEEVDTFMFEGHDTTAAGISWCLYALGLNPDVQVEIASQLQSHRNYRAAVIEALGMPLVIKDIIPTGKTTKGSEVLINVKACGVNTSDILMCQGEYDEKPKLPFIPGFEVCGEVIEVGPKVSEFQPGDKVVGLNKTTLSGFAEQCCVNEADLWKLPDSVSYEEGASILDTYATALIGLNRRGKLAAKDTVLITAAAGGLGLAAVDLAANVYKAKVIGVCDTEGKASLVRDKGAFAALSFSPKHLRDKVKEVTNGKGVTVVIDAVGGEVFREALKCVAHEGKVIVAGFASRQIPQIHTSELLLKSCSLIGVSLSHYRLADPEVYRQVCNDVIELHEEGLISPHISAVFPLEEINDAMDFMKMRKSTGKVVISMVCKEKIIRSG